MSDAAIRPLVAADSEALSDLLSSQPEAYMRDFRPFAFDRDTIADMLSCAREDRFWAIESEGRLAGFFMLRGFDEGYARPSFGIAVAENFSGRGLGKAALDHALAWCRARGVAEVMLKAADGNRNAVSLYLKAGFRPGDLCPRTGHRLYTLELAG